MANKYLETFISKTLQYALVCTSGWSDAWILFPLAPMDWYIASWEFSLIWMLWSKQKMLVISNNGIMSQYFSSDNESSDVSAQDILLDL